jgi:actin-related protein
MAQSYL